MPGRCGFRWRRNAPAHFDFPSPPYLVGRVESARPTPPILELPSDRDICRVSLPSQARTAAKPDAQETQTCPLIRPFGRGEIPLATGRASIDASGTETSAGSMGHLAYSSMRVLGLSRLTENKKYSGSC